MKLSVCCIVKDDTFYLEMMIKSVLDLADEIIIVEDIGDNDDREKTPNQIMISKFKNDKIKYFDKNFGQNFGEGRQFANDQATGDWIFFLDADEVIHEENVKTIKPQLEQADKAGINCVHCQYIHFYNDFAHIDASEPIHIGLQRLYKNQKGKVKLNHRINHSLPIFEGMKIGMMPEIIIWHLGYLRGVEKVYERFWRNYNMSEIHNPIHQVYWRDWHYFGDYPTKRIDRELIPKVIQEGYKMNVMR